MRRGMIKILSVALAALSVLAALSGCVNDAGEMTVPYSEVSPFGSFRDIPEVTDKEIEAIEALQKEYESFSFGSIRTTEAFIRENGEVGGYLALLCEWLSGLFGVRFDLEIHTGETLEKLAALELDFIGNMRITEDRKGRRDMYFMTDAISQMRYVMIRLAGSRDTAEILMERPLRYAFMEGFATQDEVDLIASSVNCEIVWVSNHAEVYSLLESGDLDAFIGANVAEASYEALGEVTVENLYPLIFSAVSMATANPRFETVISVMDKALAQNATREYLSALQAAGNTEYNGYKLAMRLTQEELAYIKSNPVVKIGAYYDNYPLNFYDSRSNKWQGIAFDILNEIEMLTGLEFQVANSDTESWNVILDRVENGEAPMVAELMRTPAREGRFLWPETPNFLDHYALISKSEFRNVQFYDVTHMRVGLLKNAAASEMFYTWFPFHKNVIEYDQIDDAFSAMDSGALDLVMASEKQLLMLTHYRERPDYKANISFDNSYESRFGFNINEAVLCSIVDKALQQIDTGTITNQWMRKTFDYRAMVAEAQTDAQRPLLIGMAALFALVLVLILILFFRNRNEGRRLEKVVKEQTKELEYQTVVHNAMLNAIPDLIFTKDANLHYTTYNKSMAEHLGIDQEELIGKYNIVSYGLSPQKSDKYNESLQRVLDTGERRDMEWSIPRFDGVETRFEAYHVPLIVDGAIIGVLGIARDITQRKAMEEEVKSASEAKSQFIANMSHEMRTPMNVVVGLTDLMLEEDQSASTMESLKKINSAGNTLMGLINDVLDISKIEAGKLELNPVRYELPSNVADIITLSKIRLESKPVTFVLDIDETMPLSLYGDDLRIKQILNNLLSNAFKYTHKGTVTLRCRYKRDGDYVWMDFVVSDTGIGIKQEDMAKLFTDYNQVDTRANRKIEGTGLGLSITKKLIDLMDGEISVESEYGKGTTFRVRIRQGFVSDETLSKETLESLRSFRYSETKKRTKLIRSDLSYARVLLVDDFPTNLDVASGMLRKYKMKVDSVDNGQAAVDRIESGEPVYDAIFMDHMMPGMDGVEATELIRAIGTKYAQTVPIIALTANAVAGNEQMFLDKGFNAYLAKPINVMVLDSTVQRWVRDKSKE